MGLFLWRGRNYANPLFTHCARDEYGTAKTIGGVGVGLDVCMHGYIASNVLVGIRYMFAPRFFKMIIVS